eukprot:TRINITY_DN10786_c0_g1_i1.p1 TRINITY_DN10786_c0_g1~~TRINITY_DN10786_c0_g1_i1.p1  ORF type:complete len:384 (+),score=80.28 TRINITY_DN10786_c0_g1_i1:33-1154(+)
MDVGRTESTSSFLASCGTKAHAMRELLLELGHVAIREKYPSGKVSLRDTRELIKEIAASAAVRKEENEGYENTAGINLMKRLFESCKRETQKVSVDQLKQKIQSELAEECESDDLSDYIILLRAVKHLDGNCGSLTWKRVRGCLRSADQPPPQPEATIAREPDRKPIHQPPHQQQQQQQQQQHQQKRQSRSHGFFTPEAFSEEASKKQVIRQERVRRRKEQRAELSEQIDSDKRSWQQLKSHPFKRDMTTSTTTLGCESSSNRRAPTPPHRKTLTPPGTPTPSPNINISQLQDVVKDIVKQLGLAPLNQPPITDPVEQTRPDTEIDLNTTQSSVPVSVRLEQVHVLPEDASIWAVQECIQREELHDLAYTGLD